MDYATFGGDHSRPQCSFYVYHTPDINKSHHQLASSLSQEVVFLKAPFPGDFCVSPVFDALSLALDTFLFGSFEELITDGFEVFGTPEVSFFAFITVFFESLEAWSEFSDCVKVSVMDKDRWQVDYQK